MSANSTTGADCVAAVRTALTAVYFIISAFCLSIVQIAAGGVGGAQGQNYKYPHAYPNHWVKQQYLPDELKNVQYYHYGDNKVERAAAQYWEAIKG